VVAETRVTDAAERDRLVAAVTERVAEAVDRAARPGRPRGPGAVPKTSSGKIRRAATREQYATGARQSPPHDARPEGQPRRSPQPWRRRGRGRRGPGGSSTAPGSPRRCRSCSCRRGSSWPSCRAGASPSPWRASPPAPASGSSAAASRPRASSACPAAARWSSPRTTRRTPTWPRFSRSCPPTSCSWPSARSSATPSSARFARRCGHLTVDRWDALQSVADADLVARALGSGEDVLFFPEGTFVSATGLSPFRLGAFMGAARAGAPGRPPRAARHAPRDARRLGPPAPRPGLPLGGRARSLPEGTDMASLVRLRGRVADAIAAHCGEPRLDLVAAGPERPA
jgi:fatty-acyl-CoA synthase